MSSTFILSDEDLKTLLASYSSWCAQDTKEGTEYAERHRQLADDLRITLLSRKYLSEVSEEELSKKVFEYSRKLEGPAYIRLGMPRISGQLPKVKRNLEYLIDSPDDPFKKAEEILERQLKIPVFARSFWAPILQARYPDVLPNWNNKTENFLQKVGINVKTQKLSTAHKYQLISDAFLHLKQLDPSQDFYQLNHLMHYGTVIQEGADLIESLIHPLQGSYWQIGASKGGHQWEDFKNNSIAAVGFISLTCDLTGKSHDELIEMYRTARPDYSEGKRKIAARQLFNFINLKPGDRFVTNKGKSLLLAAGIVKSGYRFRPEREHHKHTVDVDYYRISDAGVLIPKKLQGKFAKTITPLTKEEFETLEKLLPPVISPPRDYSLSECAAETGFSEEILKRWVRAIERKGQAVLYGPPGTGKTFIAEHLARHLISGGDGFMDLVQFHPAYAYEDFMQGIRPKANASGQLDYPVVPGRFLEFCRKAAECTGRCVLIIDEINRANLARVFGELMYLLEYRNKEVPLASGGTLRIPGNVRIIGTMNTADRSIALVDHALRRRFAFLALQPNYDVLRAYHEKNGFDPEALIAVLKKLNNQIGDPHYEVGISFFLREKLSDHLEDIWQMEIEPYLEEYFFDQHQRVEEFSWNKIGKEILP